MTALALRYRLARRQRSSALIITLLLLSLLAILVVGFISSISFEVNISSSHLSRIQAELYAQMGADSAVAEVSNLTDSSYGWLSRPGQIIEWPTTNPASITAIDLSSGGAAATASTNVAADLNPKSFYNSAGTTSYLIDSADAQPMRVNWIYVNQDGTFSAVPLTLSSSNPVVGRFAYWVDDNSAQINLNTAWTRAAENTNSVSHVSRVELTGLFGLVTQSDADLIHATNALTPYNSLQDARRAGGGVTNALNQQSFSFTHYNHSPNGNMFTQQRIMLTTSTNLAGGTNFFNILAAPGLDPGSVANLSTSGVNTAVNTIYSYLTNTTWPLLPGKDFADKYAPGNNSRAAQLALDIIEYVRCAESTNALVEPIRGEWVSGSFQDAANADVNSFIGNTRGPRITEMGFYIPSVSATATSVPLTCKIELYLPPYAGISSLTVTSLYLFASLQPNVAGGTAFGSTSQILPTETSSTTLSAGQYVVITRAFTMSAGTGYPTTANPPLVRPGVISARIALKTGTAGQVLDVAPLQNTAGTAVTYTVDPVTVPLNSITSDQVNDPFVNKRNTDWVQKANTFGAANSVVSTLGNAPGNYSPQQDTDANGKLTGIGEVFPAPKGSASNPRGLVQSTAELGYVHTGIEETDINAGFGAPWRTLRLQPEKAGSTDLPDWALLDLFSVPAFNTNAFVRPNSQSSGGKINLNQRIPTFVDTSGSPILTRAGPVEALLLNTTNATSPSVTTLNAASTAILSSNLYYGVASANGTLGIAGRIYGSGAATNFYFCPAQAVEMAGIADGGENSETLLRNIVDAATARGNVFTIYAIGQSLKQDKSGVIHILGESRTQNIVERWNNGTNVVFRPVFSQNLSP